MVLPCDCLGCENITKIFNKQNSRAVNAPCVPSDESKGAVDAFHCTKRGDCIPQQLQDHNQYDRGVNTSNLYRTINIPDRFQRSCKSIQYDNLSCSVMIIFRLTAGTLNGYGSQLKRYHPIFHTSNSEYGWLAPNPHTVPHRFYPRSAEFSELLNKTGMYRNYSLNTVLDKSRV